MSGTGRSLAFLSATVAALTFAGCSSAPTAGFVSARLQAVGGLAPGTPRPISGRVAVHGPNGKSYSTKVNENATTSNVDVDCHER